MNQEIPVSIRPCVSGPFKYPKGYEPLSAVYLITPKATFQEKVELKLEHSARLETDEQANQMTFLSAKPPERDSEQHEIEFTPVRGGKFTVDERHGILQLKHFCYFTTATKSSDTSKQ